MMNFENQIDAYIKGTLSMAEEEIFRQELMKNSNLATMVKKREIVISGLEALGNKKLKKRIEVVRQQMLEESIVDKSEGKRSKINIRYWMIAAAAIALILIVWLLFTLQDSNPNQLFAESYKPYTASFGSRDIDGEEHLIQAEAFYKQEDFLSAIPFLEKALEKQPSNSNLELALGNAYLASGQKNKAIRHFEAIIQRNDSLYGDQASWYLALSFLKDGQVARCQELLFPLSKDTTADFYAEAKALLKRL